MDDREWIMLVLNNYIAEEETCEEIAGRILAGIKERGWTRGGGVTLKHDDKLTGRGVDLVRDWKPNVNGDTAGD